ncbi:MAG: NAD-dependent epimerase/dehydratase family protein [Clostridia bacterium]
MDKKVVFITGASGSMGSQVLECVMGTQKFKSLILLRDKPNNRKLADKLAKKWGADLEVVFGDLSVKADCEKVIAKADYVFHCAAVIPPISDHNPKGAERTNYFGTVNLVDTIKASPRANDIKYVHIGTVAEYGNRTWQHPWGRVGDPLLPSVYDFYAITKLRAERYVLEAQLPNWVVLRQSGVLHHNLFKNNMADGLMFHTPWNVPIEWSTAHDSGILLQHIAEYDSDGSMKAGFWNKVYNIGNGESCRVTGYETLTSGFQLMGATAKDFFKPNWNASRNFHCFWYYDSDVLNDYTNFRTETWSDYWSQMKKLNWYFAMGRIVPKSLVSKLVIQRLFKDSNAPKYWLEHGLEGRVQAFFGSREEYNKIGEDWENYPLLCESKIKDANGNLIDYSTIKNIKNAKPLLLDHGYDETKPDSELDIADMQQAAAFRGGKCLSETMKKGDLTTKLKWQCHDGHIFESSPYTVLKAGHWCPECCMPAPWKFDELSKHIPFFAQVWNDTHTKEENNFYAADCYKDILTDEQK